MNGAYSLRPNRMGGLTARLPRVEFVDKKNGSCSESGTDLCLLSLAASTGEFRDWDHEL